ncbi:MAG: helix-turn-helix transcriptional regulator [Zoogloea sp.]|uniref:helix-turn-helix domain-containing protein n=1 Tax=Zoogloea sp. TaxID=49181 RepID=UPI00261ADAFC|nr:helix-turn-helix transcriptional regulator [Zoogloea sp.]MDD2989961.1 helix-turn-helix transcriptional regulator [Zoogloea sp.]
MTQLHKRFGEVIRRRRLAAGLSQEEFADRAGLSRSYSGEVERGYSIPSLATALKIAAAFGVPLSELVEEAEEPPARAGAHPAGPGGSPDFGGHT